MSRARARVPDTLDRPPDIAMMTRAQPKRAEEY
jgi:hypothetical protein